MLKKRIQNAYLFDTGNLATFDFDGNQVPELQGAYSIDTHKRILLEALDSCEFKGFDILPYGFQKSAKEWANYFRKKDLSFDEINQL